MNKIKQKIIYFLGGALTFWTEKTNAFPVNVADYGIEYPRPEQTLTEKTLYVISTPVFIAAFFLITLTIGIIIFIKRRQGKK